VFPDGRILDSFRVGTSLTHEVKCHPALWTLACIDGGLEQELLGRCAHARKFVSLLAQSTLTKLREYGIPSSLSLSLSPLFS